MAFFWQARRAMWLSLSISSTLTTLHPVAPFLCSNHHSGMTVLSEHFDVVVMLTWSDWNTEPRSNRYHFATRFARELPVLFVQTSTNVGSRLKIGATEINQISVVQLRSAVDPDGVDEFLALLRERGFTRPLVWIYNSMDYQLLIEGLPNAFFVYYATEDYFTDIGVGAALTGEIGESVKRTLPFVDMLIGVSANVVRSYKVNAEFAGPTAVIENGCDSEFFLKLIDSNGPALQTAPPAAIFQGGINKRLDFGLLLELVSNLPNWQFWFCGAADENLAGWRSLVEQPNVKYFGSLKPEDFGELMCRSRIGIIPFVKNQYIINSFPLKAYEYVACGLPVVTVPIAALEREPDLFASAATAQEFAAAIVTLAQTRFDSSFLARRREAAIANSYDSRFRKASEAIIKERADLRSKSEPLNAVLLYDDKSTHISTIEEHINSFKKYSSNNFNFMPATAGGWSCSEVELADQFDLSIFDVLVIHYSVRLSLPHHLMEPLAKRIERFRGLKILFIQDEYDTPETTRRWMDRLHFDIVYTCIPRESRELVYPTRRYPTTEFLPTLTGYVPESPAIDQFATPIGERRLLIAYRGRKLPFIYGTLGYEKYRIGLDVRSFAQERGLPVDIEVDDSKRIYGVDWFRFLGSARATLGTESGSNLFDFDGTVAKKIDELTRSNSDLTFNEVRDAAFHSAEGAIQMNQVSPKIFEAIRLRTALVLFEGSYSGTVKANVHFIPLKKDYSNIDEVFTKLQSVEYLKQITDRAYTDVIESGRYSYRNFVQGIDRDIARRVLHGPAHQLFSSITLARGRDGTVRRVLPKSADGFTLTTHLLGKDIQKSAIIAALTGEMFITKNGSVDFGRGIFPPTSRVRRLLLRAIATLETSQGSFSSALRYCLRLAPSAVRSAIVRHLSRIRTGIK